MRVLLATDGSSDAQSASAWLAGFPLAAGSTVRVVTVATVAPSPLDIPTVRDFQAALHQEARAVADTTCATLAAPGLTVEARVLTGDPREEVVRAAEEWPADLVVLGARGLSAMAGLLLGSVSTAVARHAPCPVVVVKGPVHTVRRVLIGIDGSEAAQAAVTFVAGLPLPRDATVHLLGVVERPHYPSTAPAVAAGVLRAAIAQAVDERTAALRRALDRAAATLGPRAPAVVQKVLVGDPADAIVRAADTGTADLIVVGARGLGALKRLLLGSVSESVLRHAGCSVLIVRGTAS